MAPYPHCNQNTLHAPGECVYCDKYPDRQEEYILNGTPFCTLRVNGWSGNTAVKSGETHTHMGVTYVAE